MPTSPGVFAQSCKGRAAGFQFLLVKRALVCTQLPTATGTQTVPLYVSPWATGSRTGPGKDIELTYWDAAPTLAGKEEADAEMPVLAVSPQAL